MSFTDQLERFEPSSRGSDIIGVGLNRLKRYWPEVYDGLIGMKWFWCPYPEVCGGFAAINLTEVLVNPFGMKRIENSDDPEGHSGFLFGHEGKHKFDCDSIRFLDLRNRDVANQALDYHNNYVIHLRNEFLRPKIGFTPFPLLDFEDEHGKVNICHDMELAEGRTKRAIYQILMKNEQQQDNDQQDGGGSQQDGDDSDDQQGGGSQSQPQGGGDDSDDSDDSGDQQQDGSSGSQQGEDLAEEAGANQTGRSMSTLGGNLLPDKIPEGSSVEKEMDKAQRQIDSVVLSNQIAEKQGETFLSAGDLKAARAAEQKKNGGDPVPWDVLLADQLDSMLDPTWFTPYNHESFITTGMLMDSKDKPSIGTVAFAVDMSMSMTDEQLANQLGRIAEFCANQQFEKVILIPIDDKVGEVLELNYGDPFPDKLTSLGCGCTALDEVFTYLEREQLDQEISVLFFFTDGYTTWSDMPQEEPLDYKVFWLDYGQHPDQYIWGERLTVDVG